MEQITILALKYPDRLHYYWQTELFDRNEQAVVTLGSPGRKVVHVTKKREFVLDNWCLHYFPVGCWYNVFVDFDRHSVSYYCNICLPARLHDSEICFVDLDIDLIGDGKGNWRVVDEDEFVQNKELLKYPLAVSREVPRQLRMLQWRVALRRYPFDGTLERYMAHALRLADQKESLL